MAPLTSIKPPEKPAMARTYNPEEVQKNAQGDPGLFGGRAPSLGELEAIAADHFGDGAGSARIAPRPDHSGYDIVLVDGNGKEVGRQPYGDQTAAHDLPTGTPRQTAAQTGAAVTGTAIADDEDDDDEGTKMQGTAPPENKAIPGPRQTAAQPAPSNPVPTPKTLVQTKGDQPKSAGGK